MHQAKWKTASPGRSERMDLPSRRPMAFSPGVAPQAFLAGTVPAHNVAPAASSGAVSSGPSCRSAGLLEGYFGAYRCRPGLVVHTSDTCPSQDLSSLVKPKSCLTFFMITEGSLRLEFEGRSITLGPGDRGGATGHLYPLTHEVPMMRYATANTRVRKVVILVEQDWLTNSCGAFFEDGSALGSFCRQHGRVLSWRLSKRARGLAEQLLNPVGDCELIRDLQIESRAIELIADAFGEATKLLAPAEAVAEPLPSEPLEQIKANQIHSYVMENLGEELALAAIAQDFNMSLASLQRVFKRAFGTTLGDFIREQRLTVARDAMVRDGLSIAQAAYVAGYSSPANFTTAFKRAFGIAPSDVRR